MWLEANDILINELSAADMVSYIEQDAYVNINAREFQALATPGLTA